jgi:NitT/TauT family transport system ATP-binding protein
VVGPTGCGKSTTLSLVSGLEPPSSGEVDVNGEPVRGIPPGVGYMFQSDAVLPWRSVVDNVAAGPRYRGVGREEARTRAMVWVDRVGLGAFAKYYPHQLSGGMRKRVSLAQTLVNEPKIMLMDEPFSALDAITRDEMGYALARIWDTARKTAIFITHSIREAIFLSDRVLVMGRRPSTIIEDVRIPFERPRDPSIEADPRFNELYLHLKASIHRSTPSVQ